MPKIYVVGATIPAGGPRMAYHIGRILHQELGYGLIDVRVKPIDKLIFEYDVPMQAMPVAQMENAINHDDVFIANPLFSSHLFGLRLPGYKIMYIQGYYGYPYLDCHFDYYAAVSSPVQKYVEAIYDFSPPIISPFIDISGIDDIPAWEDRKPLTFFIYQKFPSAEHEFLKNQVCQFIRSRIPHATFEVIVHKQLTQKELFQRMKQNRYFINISIGEGFGLMPLEAMALGCTVIGLDGVGGRDYMCYGTNCLTVSFREWKQFFSLLSDIVASDEKARSMAIAGQKTAASYAYEQFAAQWKTLAQKISAR